MIKNALTYILMVPLAIVCLPLFIVVCLPLFIVAAIAKPRPSRWADLARRERELYRAMDEKPHENHR